MSLQCVSNAVWDAYTKAPHQRTR